MKHFTQLATVDVAQLTAALEANPHFWGENADRIIGFKSHGTADFDDIWVHMPTSGSLLSEEQLASAGNDLHWHEAYFVLPLKEILYALLAKLDGEGFGRVVITRMRPGDVIGEHTDYGLEDFLRCHIAIASAPNQLFKCNGETFTPSIGDVFCFDNALLHSVENHSDCERITIIVDIKTQYKAQLLNRTL